MQADQMGRPAINTVFNNGADKNTFNVTQPAGQRDVIDTGLNLVTNGKITGDGAGPHNDHLSDFPYLGNPHV